jgi:general secretion pathway protein C
MTRVLLALTMCSSTIASADVAIKCHEAAPNTQIAVSFKPETSIQDLVYWVAGFSCKSVVIAPGVAKHATKVTLLAPRKMTPKQALQLFVDAVESTGLVVTQKPETLVIQPGPSTPKNCPDIAQAPTVPTKPEPVPPVEDPAVDKLLATIRKLDDTHYEVPIAVIDALLANPMVFAKGARVVPAIKNGKPDGIKVYAIRPGSTFARIGFQNGDTLHSVNGMKVDNAENGLEIYQKLRTAKRFDITLIRTGKPVTLVITIK